MSHASSNQAPLAHAAEPALFLSYNAFASSHMAPICRSSQV